MSPDPKDGEGEPDKANLFDACYRCELGASARHKAANLGVAVTVVIGPHDGRAETVGFGYNCRVGHHKPLPVNSYSIVAVL